jgi:hypothetical protein
MQEEWKSIDGYEAYYQVSNMGRVKSLKRSNRGVDMVMTPAKAATGGRYRSISLSVKGRIKKQLIHRLVAKAFIPNPHGYLEVNHIDGIPSNNIVTNLEWCDKRHNHLHAYAIGLQKPVVGEKVHTHKFTEREVKFLRYIKGLYPQIKASDIQKFYDISWRGVENVWTRKTWKHC